MLKGEVYYTISYFRKELKGVSSKIKTMIINIIMPRIKKRIVATAYFHSTFLSVYWALLWVKIIVLRCEALENTSTDISLKTYTRLPLTSVQ